MADLIDSVADLIEERDREGLEEALARVTFDIAGARALTFWRTYRRADGVWLRRRVALPAGDGEAQPADAGVALAAVAEPLRLAHDARRFVRWRAQPGAPAACALPVVGGAEVLGLIEIEAETELSRERLAMVAGMLRIYRSHLAALDYGDVDELTRLANRRTFDDQFRRFAHAEAQRLGPTGRDDAAKARAHLGVADIDFFKQVNDRFGHPYGDEVLVLFSQLMRATFRETDKLFRFGGEEFVALIAQCSRVDALAAFERFRAAVAAYHFPQVGAVTVSIGVTSLRRDDTGSAAFGRADQALYVAKRSGRNRVLTYEALHEAGALESRPADARDVELF